MLDKLHLKSVFAVFVFFVAALAVLPSFSAGKPSVSTSSWTGITNLDVDFGVAPINSIPLNPSGSKTFNSSFAYLAIGFTGSNDANIDLFSFGNAKSVGAVISKEGRIFYLVISNSRGYFKEYKGSKIRLQYAPGKFSQIEIKKKKGKIFVFIPETLKAKRKVATVAKDYHWNILFNVKNSASNPDSFTVGYSEGSKKEFDNINPGFVSPVDHEYNVSVDVDNIYNNYVGEINIYQESEGN